MRHMTPQQLSMTKMAIPSMIRTILKPWKEYFSELLNHTQRSPENQSQFHPSYKDNDEEPIILRPEVQQAIKTSPKNKSPGIDGVKT